MSGFFTDNNKKLHQFAGSDSSTKYCLPVGTIFQSAIPLTDASVHLLDGSTISQTGVYQEFAELLKSLVSAGYDIIYKDDDESTAQQKFDDDISKSGNCGKFIINGNSTIRLPKITRFVQGLSNMTNIGDSVEAGLPNITGSLTSNPDSNNAGLDAPASGSGAIKATDKTGSGSNVDGTSWGVWGGFTFDASRSSAIYGKSSTVQPQATSFPYYIVLANGFYQDVKLNIDNVMNEINPLKKRYVVETSVSGGTWYTTYSDGWKECGLFVSNNSSTTQKITLPVSFSNTDYTISCQAHYDSSSAISGSGTAPIMDVYRLIPFTYDRQKTYFYIMRYNSSSVKYSIYCCGY